MYTAENIGILYTYFDEMSYTEKAINSKNNESDSIKVSFSVVGLRSRIVEVFRDGRMAYVIKIDSDLFILKVKFTSSFDIIGITFPRGNVTSSNEKDFDDLILISFEKMRIILNHKLNDLLKFTNFSPEKEYEFWESGQSFNKKAL